MTEITTGTTVVAQDEEPLLEQSMECSYSELISCLNESMTLPIEISERVAQFLVILPVQTYRAVSYSSKRKNIVPKILPENPNINDDNNTCWASDRGTMPNGIGREYVEFDVTIPNKTSASRLSAVSIANPMVVLIGVRTFQLEAILLSNNNSNITSGSTNNDNNNDDDGEKKDDNNNNNWTVISDIFTVTTNGKRWEKFTIEPVDVSRVRIVFLSNQSSVHDQHLYYSHVYCYSMKLE